MSNDKELPYCVVKASTRAAGAFLSILLAVGGAVTATYGLRYLAKKLSNSDEISPSVGDEEDI